MGLSNYKVQEIGREAKVIGYDYQGANVRRNTDGNNISLCVDWSIRDSLLLYNDKTSKKH